MESSDSAPSIPLRSKKAALHVTPKKSAKHWAATDRMVLETPEKPSQPLPRIRNQNFALSRKDVKKKILSLHQRGLNGSELDSTGKLGSDLDRTEKAVEEDSRRLRVGGGDKGKSVEGSIKLPEKYDKLCKFFNSMVGVIPLLRMRRMSLTFSNICPKVESLTDRRFTLAHLAQLKYILPEAIVVKKIRVRDEQTDCIKEELHITLDRDALKSDGNGKDLRKDLRVIFQARVEEYHKLHSMDDVPEGELPALFYEPKPKERLSNLDQGPVLVTASHVSPCFQRSFSRKGPNLEGTLELQTRLHVSESSLGLALNEKTGCVSEVEESSSSSVVEHPTFLVPMSPVRDTNSTATNNGKKTSTDCHATPVKDASTPAEIMTSTPATQSLKRCMMSPDDDKTEMPTKLVRRPPRSRSLKFDLPVEETSSLEEHKDMTVTGSPVDMDLLDLLPENLLQSVREKERKKIEEQDPAIAKRRQQLMSGVPKLLDVIHLLFQSINRSVVTKDELLYRVVANHSDIVDKGEIEEQLRLLLELAPEYISERMCSSGDILVCLNKSASAQSVRAKLLKA